MSAYMHLLGGGSCHVHDHVKWVGHIFMEHHLKIDDDDDGDGDERNGARTVFVCRILS